MLGIGGIFLRADDPEALRAWYEQNLGIPIEDWGGHPFVADAGDATFWSIFPGDTEYWPAAKQTMVNYRVRDLDAMLAQLRAKGAAVEEPQDMEGVGRFGWVTDPEGNRIELWQPVGN